MGLSTGIIGRSRGGSLWWSLAGSALALLSAVVSAMGAKTYRWAADIVGEITPVENGWSLEWGLMMVAYAVGNIFIMPVCIGLAAVVGEVSPRALTAGLLFGVLASLPAAAMTQKANLDTQDLMVNTIR